MKTNAKEACPRCHIVLSTSARQRKVCPECGARLDGKGAGADADSRVKRPDANRRVKPL